MVVLQQRISRLFNRNVGEMLALLELAAAGNLAAGLLNEAILVGGPVEVQQLRARFTEVTVSMGTIRLNLATTPENQVLLSLTTPMLQFGLGNDNLFDLKLRELEWQAGSEAVVSENLTLSEELTQAVNQMVASAKAAAGQAAMQVRDDAAYSRLIQTLTALLAVLTALLVAWRWVGRGIVGRILVLQRCMEAEAAGQEMVIPASGNDEISAMAGALRQFVARRKQAESDLTAAKERAESAFRELKEVQASLVQAEKMASLAGLVAGVAHEVNTPVGVCVTAASLLAEKTEELAQNFEAGQLRRSKVQEYLSTTREISALMRSNLERAGDLIRMFKQVAVDRPSGERRRFRLFEQLEMVTVSLAEPIRAGGHAVVLECPLELQLEGYAEALRQVVDSLVGNALTHAFEGQGGGKVTISAEEGTPGTVTLTVADNGRGIPADDLSRVFEPFFTTRRNRGGLGLGLHVVFNIVTAVLGGRISVESKPGVGTRFLLLIPTRAPAMQEKTPGFSRT
jgi:signal transduction histidine kinase